MVQLYDEDNQDHEVRICLNIEHFARAILKSISLLKAAKEVPGETVVKGMDGHWLLILEPKN